MGDEGYWYGRVWTYRHKGMRIVNCYGEHAIATSIESLLSLNGIDSARWCTISCRISSDAVITWIDEETLSSLSKTIPRLSSRPYFLLRKQIESSSRDSMRIRRVKCAAF